MSILLCQCVCLLPLFLVFGYINRPFQAISYKLKVLSAETRIFLFADLHHVLIEALTLVGCGADGIARLDTKEMFAVTAVNLAVVTFLFGIVTLCGFLEKLIVCFAYRLAHGGDIIGRVEPTLSALMKLPIALSTGSGGSA